MLLIERRISLVNENTVYSVWKVMKQLNYQLVFNLCDFLTSVVLIKMSSAYLSKIPTRHPKIEHATINCNINGRNRNNIFTSIKKNVLNNDLRYHIFRSGIC